MKYPELNNHSETLELPTEIWKPVVGWEGLYSVSNFGRVRREAWNYPRYTKPKILKAHPACRRYPKVVLVCTFENRGKKTCSVHRIVAQAFVPNEEGKPQVNHIDSDVMNAHASNLEWTTQKENIQYAFEQGRKTTRKGSESNLCKINEEKVTSLYREILSGEKSLNQIAKDYGIHPSSVSAIKTKRNWKHLTDKIDGEINE